MIAALFVETNGCYFGLDGVDPWDKKRNALGYAGPHRVIAHPPCNRWISLSFLNYSRYGGEHNRPGNDGGCFLWAATTVQRFGGVLEHPAYSRAFDEFDIPIPPKNGGWSEPDIYGGRSCQVAQRNYGHRARKRTWLYAALDNYPELKWGDGDKPEAWCSPGNAIAGDSVNYMSQKERLATPVAFRDMLISMVNN